MPGELELANLTVGELVPSVERVPEGQMSIAKQVPVAKLVLIAALELEVVKLPIVKVHLGLL